jgi:nucleoside-diphosphate-sugar epimerase
MTKLVITGARGFVGSNLKPYLESKGLQVSTLSREYKSDYIYKNIKVSDFNNYDAIIHLAGKAHDLKNVSNDNEYYEVNTELTKKLYDQFLDSNCKTFIYFSSVKAVVDTINTTLDETHPYNPQTVYGKSKALAEQYLLNKELPKNKRLIVLRPCMIHGPGNKGNLNLLYSFISKGIPYPFGKYNNSRSFLSVSNLCFVIQGIIENDKIASGVYNVADDVPVSTNQLVSCMASALDKKERILNVPKFIVSTIARIGDYLPLQIDTEKLKKLTENYCVSNEKLKKSLGVKELPLSSKQGLMITFKSFAK